MKLFSVERCELQPDLEVAVATVARVVALDVFLLAVRHLGDALEVPAVSGAALMLESIDLDPEVNLHPRVVREVLELDGLTGVDVAVGVAEGGEKIPLARPCHDVVELVIGSHTTLLETNISLGRGGKYSLVVLADHLSIRIGILYI